MKLKKCDIGRIAVLLGIYAVSVLLLTRFTYAYGSHLDWGSQHYAIPDYFRKLFYQTGQLFPSFAPNSGAGENIYYFSYYGLFSPIILFSYLLPFVKMSTYIQAVSILGIGVDIILFYIFAGRKFKANTAFLLDFMFLFSSCLVFHSHRHIMFVNNMPFLLLALMSVEDYFSKGRNIKLSVFCFLMILCNYYFAIPSLIAITVYGIYCYLKSVEKFELKDFAKNGAGFALRIIISVMMSAVLLLPTLAVMLNGRDNTNTSSINLSKLMPGVNSSFISGQSYSMGLSCFVIVACIIGILSKDKARRFLSIAMSLPVLFPVIIYILNAGMYIEPKVLIPFMPIALAITGEAFDDLIAGNFKKSAVIIISSLAFISSLITNIYSGEDYKSSIADFAVVLAALILFCIFRKKFLAVISVFGLLIGITITVNYMDKPMTNEFINEENGSDIQKLVNAAADDDQNLSRSSCFFERKYTPNFIFNTNYRSSSLYSSLHNKNYNNFYFNEIRNENEFRNSALTTASQNILFKQLMGEKYIISEDDNVPTGYKKIKTSGKMNLYQNDNVYPIGYGTKNLISEKDYSALDYPQSVEALATHVVVPEHVETNYKSKLEKIQLPEIRCTEGIDKADNEYNINTKQDFDTEIVLSKPLKKNQVLLLRMQVDNSAKQKHNDTSITVNQITNTLTSPDWKYYNNNKSFEYVITTNGDEEINSLSLHFSKGVYTIKDIEGCIMEIPQVNKNIDTLMLSKEKTKGDVIEGTINCSDDEWLNISVPYDNGFTAYVDGNKVEIYKSDTAFIGFPVKKGEHSIRIVFKAPMLSAGIFISVLGIIMLSGTAALQQYKKRKHK
ncbi:MAG: YfhO family protein [Oscillospiraceae bacterium]